MSVYPFELDDDTTLPRVDDNITETGQEAINALRDAVFSVQETLGVEPQGSVTSVANRLDTSLNSDGTIKASALTSIGLVTLPITNAQVASNAGILESKLQLNHSTTDLYTLIVASNSLLNSVALLANNTFNDFTFHRVGASLLSDGLTSARHVLSHIDLNSVPFDSRDLSYVWTGLKDKDGNLRTAVTAAQGLLQVNDALTDHENATSLAHPASAIFVDTDAFTEIPLTATDAQSVFNYLDQSEILNMGQHRATQHANAIPRISRSNRIDLDGYGHNVIPSTTCYAYLLYPSSSVPVDDLSIGDDVIKFVSDNSNYSFDAAFSQVKVGDIIRVNYGNGLEASYPIESIRFTPGSDWSVRINGVNLCNATDGYAIARVDRALYDVDTAGIFSTAAANARYNNSPTATSTLSSVIVSDPRGAMALGLGFDPNQINSTHYNLYLQFYPNGNPEDKVINLPAIDVSGNSGATPGKYTLNSVVSTVNDKFREYGYNYRFIAFEHNGEFGLMLADSINQASFSVINGDNSSGSLTVGVYANNVVGINSDTFDALGFGKMGANIASPAYLNSWSSSNAALLPTKVIRPLKRRYAIINGAKLDKFQDMYLATDGYWDGYISNRIVFPSTVETTYTVLANLAPSGIRAGKTLVIQPTVDFNNILYNDADYGRFIIKSVNFIGCGGSPSYTEITVLNSIAYTGISVAPSASPTLPVKLYFSYDSVDFNSQNLIDNIPTTADYKRFHEVYITDAGKTFSHERLRMPIQAETSTLLNTSNFHVLEVSSKLKGYTDNSTLFTNQYLRFYVLNYDSVTGEFDGYLGRRNPLDYNVYDTGQIVSGKKNFVTRFYDETNIDYVDVLFADQSASPGLEVMTSSSPRYVDLEIFSSLRLDDELFLLSSCEVNWDAISGENIVQYVSDRRQFGSIDETDFTDSAKDYISAADKYLHDNGVIRGLEYVSDLGIGQLRFSGGAAIVNGRVVAANNQIVTIPQVYEFGDSTPATLDWAVCLQPDGNLVPIVLTSTKQKFFATNGVTNYEILSATFTEIINQRKDLCLIYIANVTIASITVNSVSDARKFVEGTDSAAPLVWSSGQKYLGNFYSSEPLKTWINYSNNINNIVKLKGDIVINNSLDLTGFNKTVIFDGASADVYVNTSGSGNGILIGSNCHFENWNVYYTPSGLSAPSNIIDVDYLTGCFLASSNDYSNIRFTNCKFTSKDVEFHPPFINIMFDRNQTVENVIIENNTFDADSGSPTNASYQVAVQVGMTDDSGSTVASSVKNLIIKNNYSRKLHGILVTRAVSDSVSGYRLQGIIEGNTCGYIGYYFGASDAVSTRFPYGLIIKNNFTKFIGTLKGYTSIIDDVTVPKIGNVIIENNSVSWVRSQMADSTTGLSSTIAIKNNNFTADDSAFLDVLLGSGVGQYNNIALYVNYFTDDVTASEATVGRAVIDKNNFLESELQPSLLTPLYYDCIMRVGANADITNNYMRPITGTGLIDQSGGPYLGQHMVWCQAPTSEGEFYYKIQGNDFCALSTRNYGYVRVDVSGPKGIISNNVFHDPFLNYSTYNIDYAYYGPPLGYADIGGVENYENWIITDNVGQDGQVYVYPDTGIISACDYTLPGTGNIYTIPGGRFWDSTNPSSSEIVIPERSASVTDGILQFSYDSAGAANPLFFTWRIDVSSIVPKNVNIYQIVLGYYLESGTNPATTREIKLRYFGHLAGDETANTTGNWTAAVQTLTLNVTNGRIRNWVSGSPAAGHLELKVTCKGASAATLAISYLLIKYKFQQIT